MGKHFGAFLSSEDKPVAVISLFAESIPIDSSGVNDFPATAFPLAVRFRKFACDPTYQGRGIGTKLLLHAFSVVRSEFSATVIWCDARTTSVGWYRKRGMSSFGESFWKGHVEYIRMKIEM